MTDFMQQIFFFSPLSNFPSCYRYPVLFIILLFILGLRLDTVACYPDECISNYFQDSQVKDQLLRLCTSFFVTGRPSLAAFATTCKPIQLYLLVSSTSVSR
jgi:hypothetical protein